MTWKNGWQPTARSGIGSGNYTSPGRSPGREPTSFKKATAQTTMQDGGCKHEMRSGRPLNDALKQPANIAVFIFTLAKQDLSLDQNLVSVAKVTTRCTDMADYAMHLFKLRNRALTSSRLTLSGRHADQERAFGQEGKHQPGNARRFWCAD